MKFVALMLFVLFHTNAIAARLTTNATATARRIGVCGPDELNSISNVAAAKVVRMAANR